jgi:hypothetical protein
MLASGTATHLDLARLQHLQLRSTSPSFSIALSTDIAAEGDQIRNGGSCRKEMASSLKSLRIASMHISATTVTGLLLCDLVCMLTSAEPGVDDIERPAYAQLDQLHVGRRLGPFSVPAKSCPTPSLSPGSSPATAGSSKSQHLFSPRIEVALIGFGTGGKFRSRSIMIRGVWFCVRRNRVGVRDGKG